MTDPNTPAPESGSQPDAQPPAYTAPAADPVYVPPAAPASPPSAPAYGEYAAPAAPAAPAYGEYAAPAAPAAPGYPAEGYIAPAATKPGRTLGIVALVLAIVPIFLQPIALILGIVGLVQSRKAGQKNGIALAAIIVSSVLIVITVIVTILLVTWFAGQGQVLLEHVEACLDDPTGSFEYNGITLTCEEILDQSGY